MGWGKTGSTDFHKSVNRVNPVCFFGYPHKINGTLHDMVEQAIINRIELKPDIDFTRTDILRMQVWLDGKNLGISKNLTAIIANLDYDLKKKLRRVK